MMQDDSSIIFLFYASHEDDYTGWALCIYQIFPNTAVHPLSKLI